MEGGEGGVGTSFDNGPWREGTTTAHDGHHPRTVATISGHVVELPIMDKPGTLGPYGLTVGGSGHATIIHNLYMGGCSS